jgi:hypothetical protein
MILCIRKDYRERRVLDPTIAAEKIVTVAGHGAREFEKVPSDEYNEQDVFTDVCCGEPSRGHEWFRFR